jgi:iron-sulfur cluster assembly protein
MCLDEIVNELDEVFEIDGIKVIVDPMSLPYLEDTTIDYQDELMSSGFVFRNPKAKHSCGCGSSVDF